jgi:Protein of unknown function (DUF1640)
MSPPKSIVEVPRILFPRLIWNEKIPHITISPLPSIGVSTRRHPKQWGLTRLSLREHQLHTLAISSDSPSSRSPLSFSTALINCPLALRTLSKTPPVEAITSPIRYNGVYAAIFRPARRAFRASSVRTRDHHFDTLKFVQRLKSEGFSEEQAVATMKVLDDVIQEAIQNLTRTMVLKEGEF